MQTFERLYQEPLVNESARFAEVMLCLQIVSLFISTDRCEPHDLLEKVWRDASDLRCISSRKWSGMKKS